LPLAPGSQAPSAEVLAADARAQALGELWRSGPALLFFYRADCGASEVAGRVLPRFSELPGLAVAAISQDGAAETRAFSRVSGWDDRVRSLRDPEPWPASEAFGVRATPSWFLTAPGGRIVAVAEGWSRDDANGLAAEAARLLGSLPVVVARPDGPEPALRPG